MICPLSLFIVVINKFAHVVNKWFFEEKLEEEFEKIAEV